MPKGERQPDFEVEAIRLVYRGLCRSGDWPRWIWLSAAAYQELGLDTNELLGVMSDENFRPPGSAIWPLPMDMTEFALTIPALVKLDEAGTDLDLFVSAVGAMGKAAAEFRPGDGPIEYPEVDRQYLATALGLAKDDGALLRVFRIVAVNAHGLWAGASGPGADGHWSISINPTLGRRFAKVETVSDVLAVLTTPLGRRRETTPVEIEPDDFSTIDRLLSDHDGLGRYARRMYDNIDSDPETAIGAAKELVEATCKEVMLDLGLTPDRKWDLVKLYRETSQGVAPNVEDGIVSASVLGETRRIVGSLTQVVQSLAALRNVAGTGHGRPDVPQGLDSRHARLAMEAAIAVANYLLVSHAALRTDP